MKSSPMTLASLAVYGHLGGLHANGARAVRMSSPISRTECRDPPGTTQ